MSADRIDVLVVMDRYGFTCGDPDSDCSKARAAVAELIGADKEYDAAKVNRIEADNRITSGDRTDDAFRRQASAHHAYDRAVDRRRTAIARIGGDA